MLEFMLPVEHFGARFDRGMILCEFDALREPERTRFPLIGAWLRARGVEFNEVPTPSMYWRGKLWPDLFIANQLDALGVSTIGCPLHRVELPANKMTWPDNLRLSDVSVSQHGAQFHDEFIEPICQKISGQPSERIAAKFHRSLWLPIYHAPTLRARKSLPTKFHYPRAGYSGAILECLNSSAEPLGATKVSNGLRAGFESVGLSVAYVLAAPLAECSVAFVVDPSPIYRVTDQDACAATVGHGLHRLIVEYRGECDVPAELERLGLARVEQIAYGSLRMELPTLANVARGWTPRAHINDQLMEIMNNEQA